MDSFAPIINLALGMIGFMIGAELRLDKFNRYSRSIYTILFCEAFLTFLLVAGVTFLFTGKLYIGLILGALASATAPAATYSVLGQYKARGPLTTTTLSIVALDDALALLIYGFASAFSKGLIIHQKPSLFLTLAMPLFHIMVSVLIGTAAAIVLHLILSRSQDRERVLPFSLGTIILIVGLSIYFKVDPILASMVLGLIVSNLQPADKCEMFDVIKKFSPPIFILFFVLVGARLDIGIFAESGIILLAVLYMVSRSFGKIIGAYIGGKISRAKESVTKYLGYCLFDQAGVTVGLAIATFHTFSTLGEEAYSAGLMIISIITATTFILQLIAPPMIKYGIKKADEVDRDVTKEDVIEKYKVKDLMDQDFFVIKESNNLHQIIDVMKKSDGYHFPVVNIEGDFVGLISLGEIRDTFYEDQMDQLIVAGDIVKEPNVVAYADESLSSAMDMFKKKNVGFLPILEKKDSKKLVGQLEYRKIKEYIAKEVLLRQRELEI